MNRLSCVALASLFALLTACSSSSESSDAAEGALIGDDELPRPAAAQTASPLPPDSPEHQIARVLEVKRPTGDDLCRSVRLVSVGPPLDDEMIEGQTLYVVAQSGSAHRVGAFIDSAIDCASGVVTVRKTGDKLDLRSIASAPSCDLGSLCGLLNLFEASFFAYDGAAPGSPGAREASFEAAHVIETTRGDVMYISLWSPATKKDQVYRIPKQDLGKVASVAVVEHKLKIADARGRSLTLAFTAQGATIHDD